MKKDKKKHDRTLFSIIARNDDVIAKHLKADLSSSISSFSFSPYCVVVEKMTRRDGEEKSLSFSGSSFKNELLNKKTAKVLLHFYLLCDFQRLQL